MGRHDTARIAALSFGAIYGVVTIIGLIDGEDVIGWFAPLRDRGPARSPRTA